MDELQKKKNLLSEIKEGLVPDIQGMPNDPNVIDLQLSHLCGQFQRLVNSIKELYHDDDEPEEPEAKDCNDKDPGLFYWNSWGANDIFE